MPCTYDAGQGGIRTHCCNTSLVEYKKKLVSLVFFFYEKISISKVLAFLWQFSSIAVSMERSGYLLYELFYAKTPEFSEKQ